MIKINYLLFLFIIIFYCIIIPRSNNKLYLGIMKRKKKGRKRKMPKEMITEFMNKVCTISLFNESFAIQGKIVMIEGNWVKVEEKNGNRMINGDMIRDIKLMPEKYQK